MALTSTVSSKGQITIPQEVRQRLGIHEGDRVIFEVESGRTVLRPVREGQDPFVAWAGAFPAFDNREEIGDWIRQMREDAPESLENPEKLKNRAKR